MNRKTKVLINIFLALFAYLFYLRTSPELKNPDQVTEIKQITPSSLPPNLEGPYYVIQVLDGDTIEIDINGQNQKIRFVGLDTPEVEGPYRHAACFGRNSSAKTKELLKNQQVYLEIDNPLNQIDKYGRLLRYVYRASDHLFVSKFIIEMGYATEYTYQGVAHKYQSEFRQAQALAREKSLGLWDPNICPTPK